MGMNLRISAESGLLHVIVTGEFSLREAERTFIEMLDAVSEQKAMKILFDGREVKGEIENYQRFLYGKFAAETVARYRIERSIPQPQFAYVLHESILDPGRFGETVAVNRGMWVKAFDNLEDALEWLR
ncbi:MAG TPA: hypothetical protein VEI96_00055 [Thermodesulfovibrionales bacterium]|nr:hypothetical protein [Thermodesulfovibrionales bacterium]